jgi:hypothetical protein
MPDGITLTNRVDHTTERKLYAKVVDNSLNATTYMSRVMGMGESFVGKRMDYTIDISEDSQFQWITGLEDLNASAEDSTIQLQYTRTMGTQPKVQIDLESFANDGELGTIPLDAYKYKKAAAVTAKNISTAIFGAGTGNMPNGVNSFADDGTLKSTIGGQSKTTYTDLAGTYTDSAGIMTLAKLSALDDNVSASGSMEGSPTIKVTTKTIWSLYEELLTPFQRANFNSGDMPKLPLRGKEVRKPGEFGSAAGFTTLFHRNVPIIKDDSANSGAFYSLNENTYGWKGADRVPAKLQDRYEKVDLGTNEGYESTSALIDMPPKPYGWFYRKDMGIPTQAGSIAYFVVIGQVCVWEPRRNGQLYDITGLE